MKEIHLFYICFQTKFLTKLSRPSQNQTRRPKLLLKCAAIKVFDEHVSWNREQVPQQKFQEPLQEENKERGLWHPVFFPSKTCKAPLYLRQFGIHLKAKWYLHTRKNIVSSQRKAEKQNVFGLKVQQAEALTNSTGKSHHKYLIPLHR